MKQTLIVIGCPRSGTSMLAGILYHLGVDMGDNLRRADKYNPKGYFEDLGVLRVNGLIYREAGGKMWSKDFEVDRKKILLYGKRYVGEMRRIIRIRNEKSVWGTKSGMNFTLETWLPFLRNPKILLIKRNKEDVVKSMVKLKDGVNEELAGKIHDYFVKQIEYLQRKFSVDPYNYEEFMEHPAEMVQLINGTYRLNWKNLSKAVNFLE